MLFTSYIDLNGNIVDTELQKLIYGCGCGNTRLDILSDGSSYSCSAMINDEGYLGNIFNQGFSCIWHESKVLQKARELKCIDPYCMKCNCYHFCNGGCPAYKALDNKDYHLIGDDRCERRKKIKL